MAIITSSYALAHDDAARGEDLSPLWWLWVPLAVFLAFIVLGHTLDSTTYARLFGNEQDGFLELSHAILPGLAFILGLRMLAMPESRDTWWLQAWIIFAAFACLYIAGEEASWGQHWFGWGTPEVWGGMNDQNETNLHNVSTWLDQKPRHVLQAGVFVGGILVPLAAARWPRIRHHEFSILLPPALCWPAAVLAITTSFSDLFADELGISPLLFQRPSEMTETFFYVFMLLYQLILFRRLKALSQAR